MSFRLRTLTLAIVFAGTLLVAAAPASAADSTAVLHGTLSDNAVIKRSIVTPTVTVGGVPATIEGQTYLAQGLVVGVPTLVVAAAPSHLTATRMVTLVPGDNTLDVALDLTVKESYKRYYDAYNHQRFDPAWKMVHPDVRGTMLQWGKRLTYSRYVWYMKTWRLPFLSMSIKSVSSVAVWRPAARAGLPHAAYRNLKKIVRVIRYRWGGDVVTERCYNQWQKFSGRWYIIFDAAFYAR